MSQSLPLTKKLSAYSLFAGALLISKESAAQMLYTDIVPDDTLFLDQCDVTSLDLNNDGIFDFSLKFSHYVAGYEKEAIIANLYGNAVMGYMFPYTSSYTSGTRDKRIFKLNSLNPIGATNTWVNAKGGPCTWDGINGPPEGEGVLYDTSYGGLWNNGTEGYVGLRLSVNGDYHYGWARLIVDHDVNWMILEDYAIDTIPNESTYAGCMCPPTGLVESSEIELSIFPNPASSKIFMQGLSENFINAEISVLDLSGRKIFSQKISSSENEINVSSLPNGIYLLELKNESETLTKKFEVSR